MEKEERMQSDSLENKRNILIVDDEVTVRDSLSLLLRNSFNVAIAENGRKAMDIIDVQEPDLVLLDVMMPELDGVETLKLIREKSGEVPVIMLTGSNSVPTAVEAMKLGAIDYLNKPFDIESLTGLIVSTLQDSHEGEGSFISTLSTSTDRSAVAISSGNMVGGSPAMNTVFNKIDQVAGKDTTVMITGESGTGKELAARRIHEKSTRKEGPFVPINCAAIPESLIESELFGHEKGAFTSAVEARTGYFEMADGGTVFLDEIGELSLTVQVKMLRFLQEREFYRVGDSKPRRVNVRVIVATNRNLEELIREGGFRQDLYYRVNVVNIELPALRDRFEDILPLAEHFVSKFSPAYDDRKLNFSEAARERLVQYSWPGNVRELENLIESFMALSIEEEVSEEGLPPKIMQDHESASFNSNIFEGSMNFQEAEQRFEKEMILKALKKTGNVQTRAAELLGISRRILKYKMDKLGITDEMSN